MCLVQVDMVMVALSYGWYGMFFMKKLVDVDNKVVVSSVLIITGTIGLLPFRGRMGVPQRRYIYQTVLSSGRPIQYSIRVLVLVSLGCSGQSWMFRWLISCTFGRP